MLYRQVLGESFEALHPNLKRFHETDTVMLGKGSFTISRRGGTLLAALLRLPPAGERIPVYMEVQPLSSGEKWIRHFGDVPMTTDQWYQEGLLRERAGPMVFGLETTVTENGGMEFSTRRAWVMGIPLPLVLSPKVSAVTSPTEAGWQVQVGLTLPLFGWLLRYEGEVIPQWT